MNKIMINGRTVVGGKNITINNGSIMVDGKIVELEDAKTFNIEIHGNVESLTADACNSVHVMGSAGSVRTQSGDVRCGDVTGTVKTMSGDVNCGDVAGDVETMSGDINTR